MQTLYEILGVAETSSSEEIKDAYRQQAMKWHPDRNLKNRSEAEERFKELASAYKILFDTQKRTEYNVSLAAQRNSSNEQQRSTSSDPSMSGDEADKLFFEQMLDLAIELASRGFSEVQITNALIGVDCPAAIASNVARQATHRASQRSTSGNVKSTAPSSMNSDPSKVPSDWAPLLLHPFLLLIASSYVVSGFLRVFRDGDDWGNWRHWIVSMDFWGEILRASIVIEVAAIAFFALSLFFPVCRNNKRYTLSVITLAIAAIGILGIFLLKAQNVRDLPDIGTIPSQVPRQVPQQPAIQIVKPPAVPLAKESPLTHQLANWIEIGDNPLSLTYIDPSSIQSSGNSAKMWSMFDYKAVRSELDKPYRSLKSQVEYDCSEVQYRTLYLSFYSGKMGSGAPVNVMPEPDIWKPVVPGSIMQDLWKIACLKK